MDSYSIFHLEGGLGKHVAATAVAKCIKNNYPKRKLIIVCAYPEAFINLDFVDRVYRIGNTPYFYNDYIKDKDTLIFKHEPYFTTEHIVNREPLIKNWCNLYNLEYNGESPSIVFNLRQQQIAYEKWTRQKPIMVMHTNGGPLEGQPQKYCWARDMPYDLSCAVADKYRDDYHIIQICREEFNFIPNVEHHKDPMTNMELFGLLLVSQKNLLIDSSLQHAAAALQKKSTVLWIGTSSSIFGYSFHNNIQANLPDNFTLPDSYLFDYSFEGRPHECPIINTPMFDLSSIVNSLS